MKTKIFNAVCKTRYLALLVVLILTCGNAWGAYTYSGTGTFNKQSTIDGDGYYVIIFTSSGAMTNSASSNYVGVNTGYNGTSSNTISNPATSVVLQVTNYDSTNKKYYINNNSGNYLYSSGDKKIAYSATAQYWEIATVSSKVRLKTAQTTVVYMGYVSGSGFRPYTNSSTNVQSVSAIYKLAASCTTKPTVGSSLTSVSATVNSITATVPISAIGGCNITENGLVYSTSNPTPTVGGTNCTKVTTTACGGTAANKTVTISGLTCGQSYNVRGYATNAAGTSYTNNVTTQSTSACPKYTVTLKDDNTELEQATAGASVTLPSRTGCDGYKFEGWTKTWTEEQDEWTTTAPDIIEAGNYIPTADENLYPVYTMEESGGTTDYSKTETFENQTAGNTYNSTQTYTTANSNAAIAWTMYYGTVSTNAVLTSSKSAQMRWYSSAKSNYPYIKTTTAISGLQTLTFNAAVGNTNIKMKVEKSTDGSSWTAVASNVSMSTDKTEYSYDISGTIGTGYYIRIGVDGTNSTAPSSGNYNFRVDDVKFDYTEGGGSTKNYISVPDCCTQLGSISGSIKSISGTSATLKWDNLSYVDGTTPYSVTVSPSAGTSVGGITTVDGYKNCTVSGLTAGTAYTFTINAFGDASHCNRSQNVVATTPKITLGSASGTSTYIEGYGPGSKQTFTVTAVGLTGNLTVTVPSNFAVCATENGSYTSSITLTPTSGAVSTTVYFQLVADKTSASSPYAGSVTVSGGSATSQTVSVNGTVSPACHTPSITAQSTASASYNLNVTAATLSVTAAKGDAGDPLLTYQWYSNTANSKTTPTPTPIDGATSTSYTPPTTATGTKYYFCEVSSGACAVTTNISAITVNTPSITVSKTSIAFGDQAKDGSHTETFTVTGTNLAYNTGLTLAISGSSYFTIDKLSVAQTSAGAVSTTTITVTYAPTAIGNNHSATITISSTGAANKTVTLSGNSKYKITWVDQAASPATETYTYVASGKPTFPTGPTGGCDTYTNFYGWAEGTFTTPVTSPGPSSTIKVYKSADDMPTVSGDVTYYAVWADSPGGWTKASSIAAGDVVVFAYTNGSSYYKELSGVSSSIGQVSDYSSTPSGLYPLTVCEGTASGYFAFKNGSNYLKGTTSNSLETETSVTDNSSWSVSITNGVAEIENKANSGRKLKGNTSQYRIVNYDNNNANNINIWKQSAAGNCVTSCCNQLAAPENPGETPNSTGAVLTWDAVTGATGYEVKIDGGAWTSTGNGTITGYTITGKACGGTSVSWQVRATGDGTTNCEKGAATTARNFTTTACACTNQYTYFWGTQITNDNPSPSAYASHHFECFNTWNSTEGKTGLITLPNSDTENYWFVGYNGYYYNSNLPGGGRSWCTAIADMNFANSQSDGKVLGWDDGYSYPRGATGYIRIYSDNTYSNKYAAFIPSGYILRWKNNRNSDAWTSYPFTDTGASNYWETDLVQLGVDLSSDKVWVGLPTSGMSESFTWCGKSEEKNLIGVGKKTGASSWAANGIVAGDANQWGKWRIEVTNNATNWNVHFVPYWKATYDVNGGGAISPTTANEGPVSCEGDETARQVTMPAAPTYAHHDFGGWKSSADNSINNAGATVSLTQNTTFTAQWTNSQYNITATLTNVTSVTSFPVAYTYTGSAANVTYTFAASSGYRLPDAVTVTMGGSPLSVGNTGYTWDKTTGQLQIKATITADVAITISGTQTHTVTWLSNGSNYVSPVTYDHGGTLALPAGKPSVPGGCSSKVFVGWAETNEITVATSTAPTFLDAGSLGTVTADKTYRAVFADEDDSGTKWVLTSLASATAGVYIILNQSNYPFNGTVNGSGHGDCVATAVTFTNEEATSIPDGACEITLTAVTGGFTMSGSLKDGNGYSRTYLTTSKAASGGLSASVLAGSEYWYENSGHWTSSVLYTDKHALLRSYESSTGGLRVYGGTNGNGEIKLAKKTSAVGYDNYITQCASCTTPSDLAVPTKTSTTGKVTWNGVSLSPSEGFKVAWNTTDSRPGTLNASNSADVAAGTNEYTINGLTPATRYYVWVQSKCNSTWSSSVNFYTNAKITYAPGTGGTGTMDPQEVTYNTNATAAANNFDPNTGKEFTGWLSNVAVTVNGGATPTTSVPAGATINSLTQAITLTAQWADIPQYTITFNVPSGFTAVSDIVKYRDETFNFPNVTMKAGLDCASFAGWVLGASYTTQTTFYQYNETSAPVTVNATYTAVFYQEDGQSDATADEYELVTNVADLKAGEKYLIVGYKSSTYYALGMQNTNNRSCVAITVTDNKTQPTIATSTSSTDVYELTLGGSVGAWTFKDVSNTYLEANSGTQNNLRLSGTDDDKIKWVISIANGGLATIDTKYYSTNAGWHGTIFFNTTNNLFSCYVQDYASFPKVYLFKKGGANQYTTTANPSCAAKHNLSWTVDVAAGGAVKVNNQTSGPIEVREGNTVEAVVTSTTAGYQFNGWTWTTNTGGAVIANPSATTTDITMGTADAALKANFAVIQVTSLKFKALQTGESDKLGNNLTMSMYPGEGQASDPLEHTATVTLHEKLPATALAVLNSDFTWSVRVKASGAADWTNVTFSGNELGTNDVLQKYNKSNGTLQAKAAGVAEITVTANDGSGVSAKVTITVADVPMSSMTVDPTSVTLYSSETGNNSDQNLVVVPITYTPNNATFSGTPYTQGSSYTYVSTTASVASIQIQAKANVTAEHTETVTLTTKNTVPTTTGSALTATITVTVKPMPKVHFVDIVHGESFSDVVATVNQSDKTEVLFTKTTPTRVADWVSVSSDNTCETNAEHLVGWIWSEWEDVADYLDGSSSSKPDKSALETAGAGVWFTPGASINTQTYEGRTYYAVWAKTVVTP